MDHILILAYKMAQQYIDLYPYSVRVLSWFSQIFGAGSVQSDCESLIRASYSKWPMKQLLKKFFKLNSNKNRLFTDPRTSQVTVFYKDNFYSRWLNVTLSK